MKSLSILKRYYKLVNVKKSILVTEFFALLVPSMLSVLSPILTAHIISNLTVYDFKMALYYLALDFAIIVVSTISYFVYHLLNSKARSTISLNLHTYVYENVKANSKIENLSLSALSGIESCVDFNRELLFKLCFFIKSIILLAIIIYYNVMIGAILFAVSLLSVFLLSITDNKIKRNNKIFSENQQKTLKLFNSIKLGSEEERTFNIEHTLKDRYFAYVNTNIKTKKKIANLYFINNNLISLLLKTAVFALTIYLISLVKSTVFTLSLYLIFTPYLTYSAQNLISFFEIFARVGEIDNTLSELESLKFQESPKAVSNHTFESFNLTFYNASVFHKQKIQNYNSSPDTALPLTSINLSFEFGKCYLVLGEADSGKNTLFYLLKRKCQLSSGSIFIDSKNIFDIPENLYKTLISFTGKSPHFYNISINENLLMVCSNRSLVLKSIAKFGFKKDLDALPEKLNTIIGTNFDAKLIFFLGLLRAYLSGTKIIAINEVPESFQKKDFEKLKNIILFLRDSRTIIIFSQKTELTSVANKTILIEDNKVKTTK